MYYLGLSRTWFRVLIVVLLILGVFFRFVNLDRKVYWHDEVYTSLRISGYNGEAVIQEVFNGKVIGVEDLLKFQRPAADKTLIDTIKVLTEHPEHPPLYYLMARFWVQWFGSSVAVTRSLSAAISLLAFPCIYLLCGELFAVPMVGWVAIALLTISPFHILYAQEARQYSLWTVTILLSSWALLRAMRLNTKISWGVYSLTLALGFYTFLFSGLVAIIHTIYLVVNQNLRITKTVFAFGLAAAIGLLIFAPWLLVILTNYSQFQNKTDWTNVEEPLLLLVKLWGLHLSSIFFDFGFSLDHPFTYVVPPILLIFVGYSLYYLYRSTPRRVWLFVGLLAIAYAIALILPDIILGGRRSISTRYFIPCYLGVHLAIAYLFSAKLTSANFSHRKVWQTILAVLISGGVVSCTISFQADTWWNKAVSYQNPQIARIVNKNKFPLLVSDDYNINLGNLLSLSHLLDKNVRLLLVVKPNIPKIPDGFTDVFLFNPSDSLRSGIEKEYNLKIEQVEENNLLLWKLTKKS